MSTRTIVNLLLFLFLFLLLSIVMRSLTKVVNKDFLS